jgi:hypothetical protein
MSIFLVSAPVDSSTAETELMSQKEQAEEFVDAFRAICFDSDWIEGKEGPILDLFGFEPLHGESVRRGYRLGSKYLASFLAAEDSPHRRPACTTSTRWADAGLVRQMLLEWDFAGTPLADEIRNGVRYTFWTVRYRRHAGDVLMEEESDSNGTIIRLSLVGE